MAGSDQAHAKRRGRRTRRAAAELERLETLRQREAEAHAEETRRAQARDAALADYVAATVTHERLSIELAERLSDLDRQKEAAEQAAAPGLAEAQRRRAAAVLTLRDNGRTQPELARVLGLDAAEVRAMVADADQAAGVEPRPGGRGRRGQRRSATEEMLDTGANTSGPSASADAEAAGADGPGRTP